MSSRKKSRVPTCRHPDRDSPKLLCGYPLPCPYHTVRADLSADPPTVTIPLTARSAFRQRERVADVLDAIAEEGPDE